MNQIRSNYKGANKTVNRYQLDGQGGIQDRWIILLYSKRII